MMYSTLTGRVNFFLICRFTFVQIQQIHWSDISSPMIIDRSKFMINVRKSKKGCYSYHVHSLPDHVGQNMSDHSLQNSLLHYAMEKCSYYEMRQSQKYSYLVSQRVCKRLWKAIKSLLLKCSFLSFSMQRIILSLHYFHFPLFKHAHRSIK